MKKLPFYLSVFIFLISCTPSNKKPPDGLEGTWLSVSTRKDIWGGIGLFDGFFMEIKTGKRIYQYAYSDSIVYEDVFFNDSTIINGNDSINIKIAYIGKDSIQLIFPFDTTIVTYIKLPLQNTDQIKVNESDLIENEWYLVDSNYKYRVWFIDYNCQIVNTDKSFKLGNNILNWGEYMGWDIMEFDNHTYFISSSYSSFEPMVYQITKFEEDTITLFYYDTYFSKEFKEIKLIKSKPLSNEKYKEQVNKFANHKFKLIDYRFEGNYDTIGYDTVLLQRISRFFNKFGIEKEMTFKFTNDSLFITNNNGAEYTNGTWELSKDGRNIQVVTNNNPLRLLMMQVEMDKNIQLNIRGSYNIRSIYDGLQVDYLELELEEY